MTAFDKNLSVADPRSDFICKMLTYGIFNRSVYPPNQLQQNLQNLLKTLGLQIMASTAVSWLPS